MCMGQEYKIVITGSVREGFDRQQVIAAAAKLFKCSESQAERFLQGKPTSLKREMDSKTAEQYETHLKNVGIACEQKHIKSEPVLELLSSVEEKVPSPTSSSSLSLEPTKNIQSDAPAKTSGLSLSDDYQSSSSLSLENSSPPQETTTSSDFQCPKCGTSQKQSEECIQCGIIFSRYQPPSITEKQTDSSSSPDKDDMDEFDEIALFVGPDIEKYRHKFREIYQNDGNYKLQWHWPAFLVPLPWLIYRKLYVLAAVVFILQVVTPSIMSFAISIVTGMMANYVYYKYITRRLGKISSSAGERRNEIINEGGSNTMLVTIGSTILLGFLMMFLFYQFFLPPELEDALDKNSQNQQELVDAKGDPTKVKMLMLKNSILLHKKIQMVVKGEFTMPQNMDEFREVTKFPEKSTLDKWGTQIDFESSDDTMTFYSAGEDKTFDTEDDIILETAVE